MRKLLLIATLSLSLATFALAQAGGPVGSSDSVEGREPIRRSLARSRRLAAISPV